jgi:flagellar biosynthesis component FlhA
MLADDHAISQDRADLLAIVDRLKAVCLQDAFALVDTAPAVERVPIVIPIILEIGTALVPFVDNAQDGGKFLFEAIPAMRQRIEAAIGIKVTGVRARLYSTVHSDAYRVQLEEIVVAEGRAPLVDVPTFLIDTLESVLHAHAELFVGVQESEELITTWEKTPDGQSLIPEVLGSPESRLRFKRLLRTLAGERIPLTRPELILGAVRKTGLEDTESALHAIRVALAPVRFEKRQVRAIAVPVEWRWVSNDQGKTSAAATPGETLHAMATIRRWLAAAEPPEAVVADTPPLAALVRRIVAGEFPDLIVLTQDEVNAAPTIRLPDAAPAGLSEGMSNAGA